MFPKVKPLKAAPTPPRKSASLTAQAGYARRAQAWCTENAKQLAEQARGFQQACSAAEILGGKKKKSPAKKTAKKPAAKKRTTKTTAKKTTRRR